MPDLTQKVGPTGILSPRNFEEWDWPEHFAAQPDTLRYLNYVADKFDFRRDIKFDRRVEACVFDQQNNLWTIRTNTKEEYVCVS